ncbi:MAG: response regulator [Paracoccaceae bacterium]|nr:response regulator [Paracoccaceae bacterium]
MSLRHDLKVAVVDDTAVSRSLITQALDAIGITNHSSFNEAETAFRNMVVSPVHLVISDFNMPGINGLQLLQALRRHPVTQKTGFVLVTGRPDQQVIDQGRKLAMNNFIKKPFSTEELRQCIETVVGRL